MITAKGMLDLQGAVDALSLACHADGRRDADRASEGMSMAARAARVQLLGQVVEFALDAWRAGVEAASGPRDDPAPRPPPPPRPPLVGG